MGPGLGTGHGFREVGGGLFKNARTDHGIGTGSVSRHGSMVSRLGPREAYRSCRLVWVALGFRVEGLIHRPTLATTINHNH